jgi:hypothetical protein
MKTYQFKVLFTDGSTRRTANYYMEAADLDSALYKLKFRLKHFRYVHQVI